jgi:hypothetical protein
MLDGRRSLPGPVADLQLLRANVYLRRRYDSWLCAGCAGSIGDRFNQPLPARTTAFHIHGKGSATAIPDLHLPVIIVGRNCERIRERRRDHYAAQHSNQKQAYHFSFHETPFCFLFTTLRSIILFMARAVDFAVPLASYALLPLLDQCLSPHSFICPS